VGVDSGGGVTPLLHLDGSIPLLDPDLETITLKMYCEMRFSTSGFGPLHNRISRRIRLHIPYPYINGPDGVVR
jgi:hypothetical protein